MIVENRLETNIDLISNSLSKSYNEMKNFNAIFNSITILKENNIILESSDDSAEYSIAKMFLSFEQI